MLFKDIFIFGNNLHSIVANCMNHVKDL